MTTATVIIHRAIGDYLSELQEGQSALPAFHVDRGLLYLNEMLASFPSRSIGGGQREEYTSTSKDITQPVRLYVTANPVTVTLPDKPFDGFSVDIVTSGSVTVARNGWTINGTAADDTITADKRYFFVNGDWKVRGDLALSDTIPYPEEFDSALAAMLAVELSSTSAFMDAPPAVIQRAMRGERQLQARYRPKLQARSDIGLDGRKSRVDILEVD